MPAAGVDGLSRKIQDVKDFVDERVEALSRKQDSLGDSQDEMMGQLDNVQGDISGVWHSIPCLLGLTCIVPASGIMLHACLHCGRR